MTFIIYSCCFSIYFKVFKYYMIFLLSNELIFLMSFTKCKKSLWTKSNFKKNEENIWSRQYEAYIYTDFGWVSNSMKPTFIQILDEYPTVWSLHLYRFWSFLSWWLENIPGKFFVFCRRHKRIFFLDMCIFGIFVLFFQYFVIIGGIILNFILLQFEIWFLSYFGNDWCAKVNIDFLFKKLHSIDSSSLISNGL